jgi:anti-sigma regulatory factor (Ser/Thr protein kinase)
MKTRVNTTFCIRRSDHMHLPALVSAVGCSRLFVWQVCASWRVDQEQIDDAALLASELVSNAIAACGVTGPQPVHGSLYSDLKLIGIRLLDLGHSMVIEVWDTSLQPPKLIEPTLEAEHGRGLQLVDALSTRWGHYYARIGGKAVWCQLALNSDVPERGAGDDPGAFQRVIEVLRAHPWSSRPDAGFGHYVSGGK